LIAELGRKELKATKESSEKVFLDDCERSITILIDPFNQKLDASMMKESRE
jgi:hypothetical protein